MSPTDFHSHLLRRPLLPRLGGLLPALEGYPVVDLIEMYAQTVVQSPTSVDAARHFSLVEHCILNWIRTLEMILSSYTTFDAEPQKRVRAKQRSARDALLSAHQMLLAAETQRCWVVLASVPSR